MEDEEHAKQQYAKVEDSIAPTWPTIVDGAVDTEIPPSCPQYMHLHWRNSSQCMKTFHCLPIMSAGNL